MKKIIKLEKNDVVRIENNYVVIEKDNTAVKSDVVLRTEDGSGLEISKSKGILIYGKI